MPRTRTNGYKRFSQSSQTVRRFAERYVADLKKRWEEFVDYVGHFGFGRASFDHVKVDDFCKYFTDVIPLSANKGGWMYGAFAHPSGRVYATTDMGTFFVSDDGGKTFVSAPSSDYFDHVLHIAINPQNPDHIVISTTRGIFVSYDGGVTCKRGRLAVGKFLEEGAEATFKGVPAGRRTGSGWSFAGWGNFCDVANWTSDKWKGMISYGSGDQVSRLDAFGAIFSQDIFFSGYKSEATGFSYVAGAASYNRVTFRNILPAIKRNWRNIAFKDVVLFSNDSNIIFRDSAGEFQNSGMRDFSNPSAMDGRVAYRRRGRIVTDSGVRSLVADTVLTTTDWSRNQDSYVTRYYMFYRASFAPSNPNIVYALSGYNPRRFVEFAQGNFNGFANDASQNTAPDVSTGSDRSFDDYGNWWSMSYVWMSCDGGESWMLLGHTVGMWQPPNPVPDWWKDLFQNYDGNGYPDFRGTTYGQKRLTSSGARSILQLPFFHLTNNALSDGQDLSFEASVSGTTLNGQYFAPGIMMFDLAVNPQDPFDVVISGCDMFASFARVKSISFTSAGELVQFPWRTLRPYFSGGLFRLKMGSVHLVDPSAGSLTIEVFNPGNTDGLSHTVVTSEICSVNVKYLCYSAKSRYLPGVFGSLNSQLHGFQDVMNEDNVIEWLYRVYQADRTIGQTYLMRSVKRGYSQGGAFVSFGWTRRSDLEASWESVAGGAFWHNGCVALRWLNDGLYATLSPRWRRLRDGGSEVSYTLQSVSNKIFRLFEASPPIAKIVFSASGDGVQSITPIRSYHQEQYRIGTNQWSDYRNAFNVGTNNQFDNSKTNNAPHRWMKYLYAILGTSETSPMLSVLQSESNDVAVLELNGYFANSWVCEKFLELESQISGSSRFERYGNIMNASINSYVGYNLSNNTNDAFVFYGLHPLVVANAYILNNNSISFYFPLGFYVDDNYIFVACGQRKSSTFVASFLSNVFSNTVFCSERTPAVFALMRRTDPKPCFVGSGVFAQPKSYSLPQLTYANAVVYLIDMLNSPFPGWKKYDAHGNACLESTDGQTCAYNLSAFVQSNENPIIFSSASSRMVIVELDFVNRISSARPTEVSEFVSWNYPMLHYLPDTSGLTVVIRDATIRSLRDMGDSYVDSLNSVLDTNPSLVASYQQRMPVWAKGSGFEETASRNTRWCKEPNLIAHWDEHQMNAIKLKQGFGLNNRIVQWLLNEISYAKSFNDYGYSSPSQNVEGNHFPTYNYRHQTFRSGLSVLGDDSDFVYYAFQYYLPTQSASNRPAGVSVGVVRISKQLLSDPESLGHWFDGIHPLGLIKRQGSQWVWSREINKHIQFLTPVARIRDVEFASSDPMNQYVFTNLTDFGPDKFDMGLASFAPSVIWGRNDSSDGGVSGKVIDKGNHTVIYIHTSQTNECPPLNHTHAQSMRPPDSSGYTFARSNRKYFPNHSYGSNGWGPPPPGDTGSEYNPRLNRGQMFNSKIYRLVVSKSRIYTGFMYLSSPVSQVNQNIRNVVFDFVNPFDGSLDCVNDDTYYTLEYHSDVLEKSYDAVDGETGRPAFTRFYIRTDDVTRLNRWSSERWGYWLLQTGADGKNIVGRVYKTSGGHQNTSFNIYEFVAHSSKMATLYTHVSAVPYINANGSFRIAFDDVRSGWVEWDVPGFLWDCLGAPSVNTPSFFVDPFDEGNSERLLMLVQMAFPTSTNPSVSDNEPKGLYHKTNTSVAWRTVLFDVRKEGNVWRWYALHPQGLLYFSMPYYRNTIPGRYGNGINLLGSQYADTVSYNWLQARGGKVDVTDSEVSLAVGGDTYLIDIFGRYKKTSETNYSAVSFLSLAINSMFIGSPSGRSAALEKGELETVGNDKFLDLYAFVPYASEPVESSHLMRSSSFFVAPTAFGFYMSPEQTGGVRSQLCTSTYNTQARDRIYSVGNEFFKTRQFSSDSYWGRYVEKINIFSSGLEYRPLVPTVSLVRFRLKNVAQYNLLFGTSSTIHFPFDPAYGRMPSLDRSIFSDVKVLLEFFKLQSPTLKFSRGLLFAAFAESFPLTETGSYNGYIFVSADRGETWTAIKMPFLFSGVNSLDVHPDTFDLLVGAAGAYPMVFRSVGYQEFLRRLKSGSLLRRLPIKRYELSGRKR